MTFTRQRLTFFTYLKGEPWTFHWHFQGGVSFILSKARPLAQALLSSCFVMLKLMKMPSSKALENSVSWMKQLLHSSAVEQYVAAWYKIGVDMSILWHSSFELQRSLAHAQKPTISFVVTVKPCLSNGLRLSTQSPALIPTTGRMSSEMDLISSFLWRPILTLTSLVSKDCILVRDLLNVMCILASAC